MTCDCTKEDYKGRWTKCFLKNRRLYVATCPKQGCFQFAFKRLVDPGDNDFDRHEIRGPRKRDRIMISRMGLMKESALALCEAIQMSYSLKSWQKY